MVYVFLANGFEEIEAITPIDLLRRAGVDVTSVGVTGKTVEGSHKIKVDADITIDEVTTDGLEMIVLPGGNPGYKNLESNKTVVDYINFAKDNDLYVSAICAAPSILGRLGILEGKNATVYPGMEDELKGANYEKQEVVVDGKIITSRGAGTAIAFAGALIAALKGEDEAQAILDSIVYRMN